jgi:hypothetical protein
MAVGCGIISSAMTKWMTSRAMTGRVSIYTWSKKVFQCLLWLMGKVNDEGGGGGVEIIGNWSEKLVQGFVGEVKSEDEVDEF